MAARSESDELARARRMQISLPLVSQAEPVHQSTCSPRSLCLSGSRFGGDKRGREDSYEHDLALTNARGHLTRGWPAKVYFIISPWPLERPIERDGSAGEPKEKEKPKPRHQLATSDYQLIELVAQVKP